MYQTKAYSAASAKSPLAQDSIPRRNPTERDVQMEILFCGVCHSDLHAVRDEWNSVMPTVYPIVPGHEIVGRVTSVGPAVTEFKPGDLAAVGVLVDSDGTCPQCQSHYEQYCPNLVFTFNSPDRHLGGVPYGGYSNSTLGDFPVLAEENRLGLLQLAFADTAVGRVRLSKQPGLSPDCRSTSAASAEIVIILVTCQ